MVTSYATDNHNSYLLTSRATRSASHSPSCLNLSASEQQLQLLSLQTGSADQGGHFLPVLGRQPCYSPAPAYDKVSQWKSPQKPAQIPAYQQHVEGLYISCPEGMQPTKSDYQTTASVSPVLQHHQDK